MQGAARVGIIPGSDAFVGAETAAQLRAVFGDGDLDALAQHVLSQAERAVEDGSLGYGALVARAR